MRSASASSGARRLRRATAYRTSSPSGRAAISRSPGRPERTMVASRKGLYVSLYEEHLETCSILLEQIAVYRHDPELGWEDLAGWEGRLARHLDALATGNEHVDAVLQRKLAAGDGGEREAALRVMLMRGAKEAV